MILREDPSIKLVGEAQNLTDIVEQVRQLHPQVVLLDIPITEQSGRNRSVFDAISCMKEVDGKLKILVLTISGKLKSFSRYRKAGASGFILPETRLGAILKSIRTSDGSGTERNISSGIAGRRGPGRQKASR